MNPAHGASSHEVARYLVKSSDVISDMRVNVSEEGMDKPVVWFKERFLGDEEIIEHLVDNATSTILWSIHRPKRGWYIRIRSPSFPPGMFIALNPLPQHSPYNADAALTFACRTNPPSYSLVNSPALSSAGVKRSMDSDVTLTSEPAAHSYPPTPPAQGPVVVVHPPSPKSVEAKLQDVEPARSLPKRRPAPTPQPAVTHFLLTPHSNPHVPEPPEAASLFSRLMTVLKNNAPSHSNSFTLSPIPPPAPQPRSPASAPSSSAVGPQIAAPTPTPVPLLTFHDRTHALAVASNTGILEVNKLFVRSLGVAESFYIAVGLTYLEFLAERDSYLAAMAD